MPGSQTTLDASVAPRGPGGHSRAGRSRRMRSALAIAGCTTGGSIGYVLGAPMVAVAGLTAVAGLVAALAITLWAMFGGHDPRSPFVRLMLVICVMTGRRPGDYLPRQVGAYDPQASGGRSALVPATGHGRRKTDGLPARLQRDRSEHARRAGRRRRRPARSCVSGSLSLLSWTQ
jgi:hypothetical protein